jgi:hypothetical protein
VRERGIGGSVSSCKAFKVALQDKGSPRPRNDLVTPSGSVSLAPA